MGFIKKDVNFGLLFIIILLALSIAAIGVYYNQNYSNLSKRYNEQLGSLQKVTNELLFHKTTLNKTAADLRVAEEDESELSNKYAQLREDKEKADTLNKQLSADVVRKNAELLDKTNKLLEAQSEAAEQKTEIAGLNAKVDRYERKISALEDQVEDICGGDTSSCS